MKTRNFFRKLVIPIKLRKYALQFPVRCKIRGISRTDHRGAPAQSRAEDELHPVNVPSDKNPFNVYLYSITLNRLLGNLEKSLSEKLVRAFGKGFCIDGKISGITGGPPKYKYFGVSIVIYSTSKMIYAFRLSIKFPRRCLRRPSEKSPRIP